MQEEMNLPDTVTLFGNPAESGDIGRFLDGSVRSRIALRSVCIGWGTYQPGWRWSLHAGGPSGKPSENHVGYVLSGRLTVQDSSGTEIEIGPGEAFEVGPGHDAWVIGDDPCVALDFAPIDTDTPPRSELCGTGAR
jgi:hypothetical protein